MMKPLHHHHHQSQHRGGGTARTRPPPTTTTTLTPPRTGTMTDPFNYIVDDDLLSMESSKICQPRSTEAFKTAVGLAGMADNGSGGGCGPCQCIAFLDPFPNQLTSWRSSPNLTHYCRVCNTQLNSCKQSSIHAEGKKHAKRLAYLKFCVETSAQNEKDMIAPAANMMPLTSSTMLRPPNNGVIQQQQQQQQQQQLPVQAPPPQTMMSSLPPPQQLQQPPPIQTPTFAHPALTLMPQYMSYATPVSTASTTYYYPTCYQSYAQPMPPQQQQQQQQPTASYQVPMYQEFVPPPPVPNVPPPTMSTMVPPPPTIQTMAHYMPANQVMPQPQQQQQQQRSNDVTYPMFTLPQSQEMMNPLLSMQYSCYESPRKVISSSGYGSSSTTSTASPPSTSGNKGETGSNSISSNNSNNNKSSAESRKRFYCDLCQMAFPSQSVLENHVSGSRHIRRLKTQQPYRQLKDEMHQQHQQQQQQQQQQDQQSQERGVHRCEICEVTVNSSHQLQAHLEGHKHRVRCFRRGLQPDTTTVLTTTATTPNSSTPPSTAPSECSSSLPTFSSSPNNNSSNNNSNNNQQQQTVVNAAKTTAHSSNVRGLNNNNSNSNNSNSNNKINNETSSKAACSLLGRPRPLQPNGMPGAGLMGASPHAAATSAIISPASFIRRNGNGGGLLPLPLQPGKMTGLLVAGGSTTAGVNFSSSARVTRSNLGSKSKGRKPNRPARCLLPQDHHDSTTESDEPASAEGCKKKDVKETVAAAVANNNGNNIIIKLDDSSTIESSLSSSLSSSASASCSASTSGGDNSSSKMEINHDSSSSDEAKESEASSDSSETQKDVVVVNGKSSQTSKVGGKTSFSCDTCDVRMNSAAQLAQHLKSPKHHMKASTVDGAQSDPDKKVKSVVTESPLLNMFLKTLVTSPQAFFSTSSDKEGEEGSNTEVER